MLWDNFDFRATIVTLTVSIAPIDILGPCSWNKNGIYVYMLHRTYVIPIGLERSHRACNACCEFCVISRDETRVEIAPIDILGPCSWNKNGIYVYRLHRTHAIPIGLERSHRVIARYETRVEIAPIDILGP